MDWGAVRIRPGAYYCPEHGEVRPRRELVGVCPSCGRMAHVGVREGELVVTAETRPDACRRGHPLGALQVLVGTRACSCAVDGMHRTWACRACGDVQEWPRHDESRVQPYFGPGSTQSSRSTCGGSGQSG